MRLFIFELLYFAIDAVKDPLLRTDHELPHEEVTIKLRHFLMDQQRVQLLEQALNGHIMPTSTRDILNKMMMEELILDILLFGCKGAVSDDLVVVPAQRAVGTLTHLD